VNKPTSAQHYGIKAQQQMPQTWAAAAALMAGVACWPAQAGPAMHQHSRPAAHVQPCQHTGGWTYYCTQLRLHRSLMLLHTTQHQPIMWYTDRATQQQHVGLAATAGCCSETACNTCGLSVACQMHVMKRCDPPSRSGSLISRNWDVTPSLPEC
jgi:hypothetical protein